TEAVPPGGPGPAAGIRQGACVARSAQGGHVERGRLAREFLQGNPRRGQEVLAGAVQGDGPAPAGRDRELRSCTFDPAGSLHLPARLSVSACLQQLTTAPGAAPCWARLPGRSSTSR